jgi:small multidrug resistance pump
MLAAAIVAEIVATVSLKASEGMTRLWPIAFVVVGYGISFYLLSESLQRLPLAFVYSVWAGVGIAGTAVVGWLVFGESLDVSAISGLLMIIVGIFVIARAMNGPVG